MIVPITILKVTKAKAKVGKIKEESRKAKAGIYAEKGKEKERAGERARA